MPTTKASGTHRAARKSPAQSTPRARSKSATGARRAPAARNGGGSKETARTAAASSPTWAKPMELGSTEPFNFSLPWLQTTSTTMPLAADQLVSMQQEYVQRLTGLWQDFFAHPERTTAPIADPRFSDPSWQKNSLASFYARTYLLNAEFLTRLAESVQGDPKTRKRVKFAVSQWVDAASPANFLALNPKAQQTLLDTNGESLKVGMDNLLKDIGKGKITQTDESAFEVGKNRLEALGDVQDLEGSLRGAWSGHPGLTLPPLPRGHLDCLSTSW